jgi:hypothetical protein
LVAAEELSVDSAFAGRGHRRSSAPARELVLVCLGVLGGAAAFGLVLNSTVFSDANGFAAAAHVLLSSNWRHTYSDSWLQAGPFEQLVCLAVHSSAIASNLLGAAALLVAARIVLGRDWKALLFVGAGAILLGVISDVYEFGHPSELFIALAWILAAQAARRDAALLAAVLLGLSAGFETWGLLGAPILFLIPSLRRTIASGLLALAVAAAIYAPFALGGDFHMFDLHWSNAAGLDVSLFGRDTAFTWPMRIAESLIVVGVGAIVAVALRRRTSASIWIVPAAASILRLALDPVRYPYYWDTGLTLILIGTAPWLTRPRAVTDRLRRRFEACMRRRPRPAATFPTAGRTAAAAPGSPRV